MKSASQSGFTVTSTIVYRIGYSGGAPAIPIELHVVSMKLKVVQQNALPGTQEDLLVMTLANRYQIGNMTVYWQKIYSNPYPHCTTDANGYCTFTKSETLPTGLNVPYSTATVGIYGGGWGPGGIHCDENYAHKFVPNSAQLDLLC